MKKLLILILLLLISTSVFSAFAEKEANNSPNEKIFITKNSLPSGVQYQFIAEVKVKKISNGSITELYSKLASKARELGANAIININGYRAPSFFSWAAPHLCGQAIKLQSLEDVNGIEGTWY